MKIVSWFEQTLKKFQPNVFSEKNLKNRAKELLAKKGPCGIASLSSSARPFFELNTDEDSPRELARAIVLTMVIGSLHKDADYSKLEVVKRLLQEDFDWNELEETAEEVLDLITGYNCKALNDYNKRPLGFINSQTFINNFSPWTLKVRDSRANAQNGLSLPAFPGTEESRQKPPVGISTSSYGYYVKHHVRNNLGVNVNHFLNLAIKIDGCSYPLQALLTLQVHPDWIRQGISFYPELQALSDSLLAQLETNHVFSDFETIDPAKGSRLLIDELPEQEEEIEVTPVTSVQLLEDYQAKYRYISSDYKIMSGAKNLHLTMTVGDGNPINIGAFASNRNGHIVHIGQSDNVRIVPGTREMINRLYNDRVLNKEEIIKFSKSKHPQESDYYFKQKKIGRFEYVVEKYLNFCSKLSTDIQKMIDKEEYLDKYDFLSFFNTNPTKKAMLELLLQDFKDEEFVEMLTNSISRGIFSRSYIYEDEKQNDLQRISSIIWRKLT